MIHDLRQMRQINRQMRQINRQMRQYTVTDLYQWLLAFPFLIGKTKLTLNVY